MQYVILSGTGESLSRMMGTWPDILAALSDLYDQGCDMRWVTIGHFHDSGSQWSVPLVECLSELQAARLQLQTEGAIK